MFTINSFIKRTKPKVSQAYPSRASICLITLVESNVLILYEKWKKNKTKSCWFTWHATLERVTSKPPPPKKNGGKHAPLHPGSYVAQDLM